MDLRQAILNLDMDDDATRAESIAICNEFQTPSGFIWEIYKDLADIEQNMKFRAFAYKSLATVISYWDSVNDNIRYLISQEFPFYHQADSMPIFFLPACYYLLFAEDTDFIYNYLLKYAKYEFIYEFLIEFEFALINDERMMIISEFVADKLISIAYERMNNNIIMFVRILHCLLLIYGDDYIYRMESEYLEIVFHYLHIYRCEKAFIDTVKLIFEVTPTEEMAESVLNGFCEFMNRISTEDKREEIIKNSMEYVSFCLSIGLRLEVDDAFDHLHELVQIFDYQIYSVVFDCYSSYFRKYNQNEQTLFFDSILKNSIMFSIEILAIHIRNKNSNLDNEKTSELSTKAYLMMELIGNNASIYKVLQVFNELSELCLPNAYDPLFIAYIKLLKHTLRMYKQEIDSFSKAILNELGKYLIENFKNYNECQNTIASFIKYMNKEKFFLSEEISGLFRICANTFSTHQNINVGSLVSILLSFVHNYPQYINIEIDNELCSISSPQFFPFAFAATKNGGIDEISFVWDRVIDYFHSIDFSFDLTFIHQMDNLGIRVFELLSHLKLESLSSRCNIYQGYEFIIRIVNHIVFFLNDDIPKTCIGQINHIFKYINLVIVKLLPFISNRIIESLNDLIKPTKVTKSSFIWFEKIMLPLLHSIPKSSDFDSMNFCEVLLIPDIDYILDINICDENIPLLKLALDQVFTFSNNLKIQYIRAFAHIDDNRMYSYVLTCIEKLETQSLIIILKDMLKNDDEAIEKLSVTLNYLLDNNKITLNVMFQIYGDDINELGTKFLSLKNNKTKRKYIRIYLKKMVNK